MADRARLLRQGLPRVSIDGDPRRVSNAWEVGEEVGEEECEVSSVLVLLSSLLVQYIGESGRNLLAAGKGRR